MPIDGTHVDGGGHIRLFEATGTGSRQLAWIYGDWHFLGNSTFSPGTHELTAQLFRNGHQPYLVDGAPVTGTVTPVTDADDPSGHSHGPYDVTDEGPLPGSPLKLAGWCSSAAC